MSTSRSLAVPPGLAPPSAEADADPGWRPAEIVRLLDALRDEGRRALRAVTTPRLLEAWEATMDAFLDPGSRERAALLEPTGRTYASPFAQASRLSPAGLDAAIGVVLGGLRRPSTAILAARVARRRRPDPAVPRVVYLAGNVPALAAQPLLRALLERRPVLLKSAGEEPFFAPALVRALTARLPEIAPAVGAVTWRGGRSDFDELVLARGFELEVYGGAEAVAALRRRAPALVAHGPMASLAVCAGDAPLEEAARGCARDVALLDQRGCLSVQAVYVEGDARRAAELARALAGALAALARELPPGPPTAAELAALQQERLAAEMRGRAVHALGAAEGTVVLEASPAFRPSPGLRFVRVHAVDEVAAVPTLLASLAGRLQGIAHAGALAEPTRRAFRALGVSRFAPAGELQATDATWSNRGSRLADPSAPARA